MPLTVDEARDQQRKVYVFLGILAAVAFFGLVAWKTLNAPRFGEPCQDHCWTGQCLRETHLIGKTPWQGAAYCSRTCKGPDDCPAGYVCDEVAEVKEDEQMLVGDVDTRDGGGIHACVRRR